MAFRASYQRRYRVAPCFRFDAYLALEAYLRGLPRSIVTGTVTTIGLNGMFVRTTGPILHVCLLQCGLSSGARSLQSALKEQTDHLLGSPSSIDSALTSNKLSLSGLPSFEHWWTTMNRSCNLRNTHHPTALEKPVNRFIGIVLEEQRFPNPRRSCFGPRQGQSACSLCWRRKLRFSNRTIRRAPRQCALSRFPASGSARTKARCISPRTERARAYRRLPPCLCVLPGLMVTSRRAGFFRAVAAIHRCGDILDLAIRERGVELCAGEVLAGADVRKLLNG